MLPSISVPSTVASLVRPGDILAFSGRGVVSEVVRLATGSEISHIGIVLNGEPAAQIIESTSLDGFTGVTVGGFVSRCVEYDGDIWWYPLRPEFRAKCRPTEFQTWLDAQDQKRYDTWGAIGSALHDHRLHREGEWFCSELAAAALQHVGVLDRKVDPALVRPCDLVAMPLFTGRCQIGWFK